MDTHTQLKRARALCALDHAIEDSIGAPGVYRSDAQQGEVHFTMLYYTILYYTSLYLLVSYSCSY